MRLAAGTQINFEKDIHSVATLDLGKHLFYEKSVISLSFDLAPMRNCSMNNAILARKGRPGEEALVSGHGVAVYCRYW